MAGSGARLCGTVLLMLVAASFAANDTCTQDLQKLQKGTYKNAATLYAAGGAGDYGLNGFFSEGGWSRVDPGNFRSCQRNFDIANYCFVEVMGEVPTTLARCVPSSCDTDALRAQNSTFVIEALRLPNEFTHGSLFITCDEVDHSYPWHSILLMCFIGLLALCVVGAGVLEFLMEMYPEWFFNGGARSAEVATLVTPAPPRKERITSTSSVSSSQYEYDVDYDSAVDVQSVVGINDEPPEIPTMKELREMQPFYLKLILIFATVYNFQRLMSVPPGNTHLKPLNFLRVMSISMVMFGHCFYFWTSIGVSDPESAKEFLQSFRAQPIVSMTYSVDQFFMLGGFLVAYLFLKTAANTPVSLFTWFMYYFHRVFRLTPAMMMGAFGVGEWVERTWRECEEYARVMPAICRVFAYVYPALLVWWQIAPYLGDGPFWPYLQQQIITQCNNYWWCNLVYINNLYPTKIGDSCFGWGWYLAVDMQYYVVTPLFLIVFLKNKYVGCALVAVLIVAVWIVCFVLAIVYNLSSNRWLNALGHGDYAHALENYGDYPNLIYYEPWSRAAPYLLGILFAFIMNMRDDNIRMPKIVRYPGYLISVAVLLFIMFITYTEINYGWGKAVDTLNVTFTRTVWCLAMGFLFAAAISGSARVFRKFTSLYMWVPLARLTYAAYLYHPIMFSLYYGTADIIPMLTPIVNVFSFFGVWALAFFVSFVNYLLLEKPMMNLESLLLSIGKKR